MEISDRQREILLRIVQEYINSARPVSSRLIEAKYNLGICSAAIRIEMQRLTEMGFIFQPHTSAGRVPSDKGYRFFVDNLLDEGALETEDISEIKNIFQKKQKNIFGLAEEVARFLAQRSAGLVVLEILKGGFFWKEGWEEIVREPEFERRDILLEFTELLKDFEKEIKRLKPKRFPMVYIGQECPFSKGRNFSIILTRCCFYKSQEIVISLLGPKRMNYNRNIGLIYSLAKLNDEQEK